MAVTDRFRRAADAGRRVADKLGQRNTTVTIAVETWTAPINTLGATSSTATFTLSPSPKVVPLDEQGSWFGGGNDDISSGRLGADAFRIGPITKPYPGGQLTSLAQVLAQGSASVRVFVFLSGDAFAGQGESYEIDGPVDLTKGQSFFLTVRRTKQ